MSFRYIPIILKLNKYYKSNFCVGKDLEAIQAEQKPIEDNTGKDYAEPNVVPKEIDDLINECKKLIDTARKLGKEIDGVKKGPPKDIGVSMHPIAKSLINLDKNILVLAEKIENLGQKLLKNGEDLRDKEKFTPELKPKFDTQGKRIESIGGRLKKIGTNFGIISEKLASIGSKLDGHDGTKMKDYARQLKELGGKVKDKGKPVEELGIKIQNLQPTVKDTGIDKDLEAIQTALGEIGNDLEAIMKVGKTMLTNLSVDFF